MVRRTLALTGVAALALGVTGLAGPAAADVGTIQADADVMVTETAVAQSTEGTAVELLNATASTIPLDGWELLGCTDASSTPFSLAQFGPTDEINSGEFLVRSVPSLVQDHGAAWLVDATPTFMHGVEWGSPNSTCVGSLALEPAGAGVVPSNTDSIQRESATIWCAGTPTLGSTNIDCP